jgi:hypothetical protein
MVAPLGSERKQSFVNEMNETRICRNSFAGNAYFVTRTVCNETKFSCNETPSVRCEQIHLPDRGHASTPLSGPPGQITLPMTAPGALIRRLGHNLGPIDRSASRFGITTCCSPRGLRPKTSMRPGHASKCHQVSPTGAASITLAPRQGQSYLRCPSMSAKARHWLAGPPICEL